MDVREPTPGLFSAENDLLTPNGSAGSDRARDVLDVLLTEMVCTPEVVVFEAAMRDMR